MSSINAFAVHIVAATIWVGGLLALVIMRSMIGPHLGVTVARYSTVATWSYPALALSGVLAAWFNLAVLGDFASAYGAMLLVKAGALLALGVAGWRQRQHTVGAHDADVAGVKRGQAQHQLAFLLGPRHRPPSGSHRTPPRFMRSPGIPTRGRRRRTSG